MPRSRVLRRPLLVLAVLVCTGILGLSVRGSALRGLLIGVRPPPIVPGLPACALLTTDLFPVLSDDPYAAQWDRAFDGNVANALAELNNQNGMACGDDASQSVPPTLLWIAARLPQWQGRTVRAADTYDILADYLEAYACALKARATVLIPDTTQIDWYRQHEQRVAVAREFLHRALLVSAGGGKLQPLVRGFVCLDRASKDLRNVLGLLGEASACIPVRTWDERGILRTYTSSTSSSLSSEPSSSDSSTP